MKRIIVEVINLIPAPDIFIGNEFDDIETLVPVAFYAQVKIVNTEYPGNGLDQEVIAVTLEDFQDDLVGKDAATFGYPNLVHLAKVQRNND